MFDLGVVLENNYRAALVVVAVALARTGRIPSLNEVQTEHQELSWGTSQGVPQAPGKSKLSCKSIC